LLSERSLEKALAFQMARYVALLSILLIVAPKKVPVYKRELDS
jgi:hypothetical protein